MANRVALSTGGQFEKIPNRPPAPEARPAHDLFNWPGWRRWRDGDSGGREGNRTLSCMSSQYGGWERIGEPIGRGGQGTVYLARSPERANGRRQSSERIRSMIHLVLNADFTSEEFAQHVLDLAGPDPLEHLGALKIFHFSGGDLEIQKADGRLKTEIQALTSLKHLPAILRLLASDTDQHFIIAEYHPRGSLDKHLASYEASSGKFVGNWWVQRSG